jgi:cytochrome c-type biogenesis protein CcsB
MTSSSLLSVCTFIYGLAAALYLGAWVFRRPQAGKLASAVTAVGCAANLAGIGLRWLESHRLGYGHAPLSNLYESLVFFSLVIALIYLMVERRYGNRILGVFVLPLAFLAMAYASLSPNVSDRIQPLLPALKSNWLIAHVITCFIGYASFAVAFGLSLMFMLRGGPEGGGKLRALFPLPGVIDELTHQMVMYGFLFLSAGIITGAVWANSAWGRYWGWDPKETWSLITWLIYATLLHARLMRGWRGQRIAMLSIVGFLAVLFTYFGVNLLPGLHSYGAMGQ